MTQEIMSPRDILLARACETILMTSLKDAAYRLLQSKTVDASSAPVSCARLHFEPYPLKLKHTKFEVDGSIKEIQELIWNKDASKDQVMRLRGPRKQGAARAIRAIETMDDRQVVRVIDGVEYDYGRNDQELRPAAMVQDVRTTNFAVGAKYSGPKREMRKLTDEVVARVEANRKRDTVDELKRKMVELEARVKKLMGV